MKHYTFLFPGGVAKSSYGYDVDDAYKKLGVSIFTPGPVLTIDSLEFPKWEYSFLGLEKEVRLMSLSSSKSTGGWIHLDDPDLWTRPD